MYCEGGLFLGSFPSSPSITNHWEIEPAASGMAVSMLSVMTDRASGFARRAACPIVLAWDGLDRTDFSTRVEIISLEVDFSTAPVMTSMVPA